MGWGISSPGGQNVRKTLLMDRLAFPMASESTMEMECHIDGRGLNRLVPERIGNTQRTQSSGLGIGSESQLQVWGSGEQRAVDEEPLGPFLGACPVWGPESLRNKLRIPPSYSLFSL